MPNTRDIATVEIKITRRLDGRELLNLAYRAVRAAPSTDHPLVASAYIAPSATKGGRRRAVLAAAQEALVDVLGDLARWGCLDDQPGPCDTSGDGS
jgi:hypothetical protein